MFGAYRYLLAIEVVIGDVFLQNINFATYAVFGFYMLSGYLVTCVLNEKYPLSTKGLTAFFLNRVLRIYPNYLLILVLTASVLFLSPAPVHDTPHVLTLSTGFWEWLNNVLILGLPPNGRSRIIPPAWSLNVELIFYVLMGLMLSRHRRIAGWWLLLGVMYTLAALALTYSGIYTLDRYYSAFAALLPFAIGANMYLHRKTIDSWIRAWHLIPALLCFLINLIYALATQPAYFTIGFYLAVIFHAWLILCLKHDAVAAHILRWRKLDDFLGNMSYPIFLCHWFVTLVIYKALGDDPVLNKFNAFLLILYLIHATAYGMHVLVDQKINKIRNRIRSSVSVAIGNHR